MKPTLILDCSIVMAWCFEDEGSEETAKIQDRLIVESAVVPPHWHLEIVNVLALAEKKKRISAADSTQFVKLVSALGYSIGR